MKKFVLIPDSFKGTISSSKICEIMREEILKTYPNATVVEIPVADGGEGSVDCFLKAKGGEKINIECHGPYMEKLTGFYGILTDKETAVIEMSAVAGLPLVENNKNPLNTTTYGVGELLLDAIKRGVKKVIIGLGGSCTNDFGCGMACACGAIFYDKNGNSFIPVGKNLSQIDKIDLSGLINKIKDIEIITMCDINNPPYGKSGAAHVFAPQKGADEKAVEILDNGVQHLCKIIKRDFNIDLSNLEGGGAAGAMGAGMFAFFSSKLSSGIETVLKTVGFSETITDADFIFTGEGKLDSQSLGGKVVIGVSRSAKTKSVPVIAVVGGSEGDMDLVYKEGVSAVFSINRLPMDLSISKAYSEENLAFTMNNIMKLINCGK